jgi:transcriptional regulator with XRE-family HTH domain
MTIGNQARLLLIHCRERLNGPASRVIETSVDAKGAFRDALKLDSAEPGNNIAPLQNGGVAQIENARDVGLDGGRLHLGNGNTERPRDIRGELKVIENVLFQHGPSVTRVTSRLQPEFRRGPVTSVPMDKLATIAERLDDAMREAGVNASQLAKACGVSHVSVGKWLKGGKLSADNLAAAARAVGVSETWLRTGRLPRERENGQLEEDMDRVIDLLEGLAGPLASLAQAIEQLRKSRPGAVKKGRTA